MGGPTTNATRVTYENEHGHAMPQSPPHTCNLDSCDRDYRQNPVLKCESLVVSELRVTCSQIVFRGSGPDNLFENLRTASLTTSSGT